MRSRPSRCEARDDERRQLAVQACVRRKAAKAVMNQADTIQREDAIFEDPPEGYDRSNHGRPIRCVTSGMPVPPSSCNQQPGG